MANTVRVHLVSSYSWYKPMVPQDRSSSRRHKHHHWSWIWLVFIQTSDHWRPEIFDPSCSTLSMMDSDCKCSLVFIFMDCRAQTFDDQHLVVLPNADISHTSIIYNAFWLEMFTSFHFVMDCRPLMTRYIWPKVVAHNLWCILIVIGKGFI